MPAVVRQGDELSTGHACDATTTLSGHGQIPSVYANNIPMAVVGASVASHTILVGEACVDHPGQILNEGSPNVFVSNIAQGRIGDSADQGNMTKGSPNVFANGT